MSMQLTRLNADTSWVIEIDGTRLLLDPWLEGAAVVGLPWIHSARLAQPPVPIVEVPPVDALVISHPFPDHCNAPTLRNLRGDFPAYAPAVARRRVKRLGRFNEVTVLGNCTGSGHAVRVGSISIAYCRAGHWYDPTHNVLVLRGLESGRSLAYCPHGVEVTDRTRGAMEQQVGDGLDLLMCSFTLLDLPFYLGGIANLGKQAAVGLAEHFSPRFVLPTHDGDKPDSGFISWVSKLDRCADAGALLAEHGVRSEIPAVEIGSSWSA